MDSALWCSCLIYVTVLGSWHLIWTIRAPHKLRTETSLPYLCRIMILQPLTSLPFFSELDISSFYLHGRYWMMWKLRHAMVAIIFASSSPLILAFPGQYSLPLPFALLSGALHLLLFSIISQLLEGEISFFFTASLSHWKLLHLIKVDS
jgi:hypothetical protein